MRLQSLMKFHHCLFKILRKNQNVVDKELRRAITLTELAPSPYFSIINVHLVNINMSAKFYEIPSLLFQDIEKPKTSRTDGQCENSILPTNTVCRGYKNTCHHFDRSVRSVFNCISRTCVINELAK